MYPSRNEKEDGAKGIHYLKGAGKREVTSYDAEGERSRWDMVTKQPKCSQRFSKSLIVL
jgi:hypothetical protein